MCDEITTETAMATDAREEEESERSEQQHEGENNKQVEEHK